MRGPRSGDGHVALRGYCGHGEDRRHDGHVGHEVCHPAEDQPEYPVSVTVCFQKSISCLLTDVSEIDTIPFVVKYSCFTYKTDRS